MPNFANPFSSNIQRRMTDKELLRAIRQDIAGEQEAIFLYEAHADACQNSLVAKVLRDIAAEEKTHVHELQTLLYMLDLEECGAADSGTSEVIELAGKDASKIRLPKSDIN